MLNATAPFLLKISLKIAVPTSCPRKFSRVGMTFIKMTINWIIQTVIFDAYMTV